MSDNIRDNNTNIFFWKAIEQANRDGDTFRSLLAKMSNNDLVSIMQSFDEASAELTDEAYLKHIDADQSEDGVNDIARWVVSQGQEFYDDVLAHPNHIPGKVAISDPANLYGLAQIVYREKFGKVPVY